MAGGIVTVMGAAGHAIPVTVNGSYAFTLAQSYADAVLTASAAGTLFSTEGDGAAVPAAPGSAINQYVASSSGYYTYPSGYDHFVTDTGVGHIFIDASAASSGTTLNTLVGTGGSAYLAGNESGTFIAGGGNNLFMDSGSGMYTVATSDGNDSIFAGSGGTLVEADTGDNLIVLSSGADTVNSQGTDRIFSGSGAETISMFSSSSTIYGGTGNMVLDDTYGTGTSLTNEAGNVVIYGGTNSYYNISGTSDISAGTGDTITASGNSTVFGSSGTTFTEFGSASLLFIGAESASATVDSGAGDATVFGSNGSDITYSGHGTLVAGSGNETLNGSGSTQGFAGFVSNEVSSGGTNMIIGGTGADTLVAGLGTQTLTGGSGSANQFIIAANGTMSSASITISDFGSAAGNMVYLYGYSGNEVADTLASQQTVSGGVKVTLADSSTVTFLGLSNLSSNDFKGG